MLGLNDESMVLSVIVRKIITNLKYWGGSEGIISQNAAIIERFERRVRDGSETGQIGGSGISAESSHGRTLPFFGRGRGRHGNAMSLHVLHGRWVVS